MNRERISRAVAVVRGLIERGVTDEPDEVDSDGALNMASWGRKDECGTSACLGGWMTLDPALRDMGLQNRRDQNPRNSSSLEPNAETRYVDRSPLEDYSVWLSAQLLILVLFRYANRT